MKHVLEDARKLIATPSSTADGNEEVANRVAALMRSRGLKVQLQQVGHSIEGVSKRQFNVIGIFGDPLVDKKTRKGLLLTSHLDTVGPGLKEHWAETSGNPFAAVVKDGRLFGLGAADAKVDLLCKLRAIEKFREQKLRMPIYLVGSCGEEMGMFGARYLIKSMALNPRYVLVGDPTGLEVVTSHKASVVFRATLGYTRISKDARGFNRRVGIVARGRSAHGADPERGQNAILRLLEFVRLSIQSGFDLRLTACGGGESASKVPDRAVVELFVTSHQLEDFRRFFSEYCHENGLNDAFEVEFGGLGESGVQFLPEPVFQAVCDAVALFGQLSADLEASRAEGFLPAHATVNLGQVRESSAAMDLLFDVRLLPGMSVDEVESRLKTEFLQLSSHYPGVNISVLRERASPALDLPASHAWAELAVAAAREVGLVATRGRSSGASEAALYHQAGYDAVAFGPGEAVGNSHAPDEWVSTEQIEKAIRFYEKAIEKTCL